jgi:catalase
MSKPTPTRRTLTTESGAPVADNQNSATAGVGGPVVLQDQHLLEKLARFNRERIPERVVHARGSGAFGHFEVTDDVTAYTSAHFLGEVGRRTELLARFSTVADSLGGPDAARDPRGFALKFYTEEGNYDLVGNNTPVFFLKDPLKFPDFIHTQKRDPFTGQQEPDNVWDFFGHSPEATHQVTWVMGDRGIPASYRHMNGFGSHTYQWTNAEGESYWVKYHFRTNQGVRCLSSEQAAELTATDPNSHQTDLLQAIERGVYPSWTLYVQLMPVAEAADYRFNPFDLTKVWPHADYPLHRVGRMVLNRNPDNFFAETEQVAFCTAHVVPGIDFTNDPLLAGRIHSYVDTQITRLGGPNFHEIPINAPVAQVHNNQRDGFHRQAIARGRVAYEPNSLAGGCPFQAGRTGFTSFPEETEQHKVRGKPEKFAEHYNQARLFWNSQSAVEKAHIVNAFRFELTKVQTVAIRKRMVAGLANVAAELAERVAAGLGFDVPEALPKVLERAPRAEVNESPALSLLARPGDGSIATRNVAIIVADGVDGEPLTRLHAALAQRGAVPRFVGATLGRVASTSGEPIEVEISMDAGPSVLYDAVVLPDGEEAVTTLSQLGHAMEFVKDQYRHCKPILAFGASGQLLEGAGIWKTLPSGEPDPGVLHCEEGNVTKAVGAFVEAIARHRHFERETLPPRV